jgi:hypothetical protein
MKSFKLLTGLAFVVLLIACKHEKVYNQVIKDPKTGQDILYGYCDVSGIKGSIFQEAYVKGMSEYVAHDSTVQAFKPLLQDVTFKVFMGSWDVASQNVVPVLVNVLFNAEFDATKAENIELVCLDSEMKCEVEDPAESNVKQLPTVILYNKGNEFGRIEGTPSGKMESVLLQLLKQKK